MENKVIGFKGFDKDLKCRDKQYEVGQTFEEPEADLCNKGLHFCENPMDVLSYYSPVGSRFAEVEADEVSGQKGNDSKRVAKKLKIKAEINLKSMVSAAVKFILERAKVTEGSSATNGDEANSATNGYEANSATNGYKANSATNGDFSKSEVKGTDSVAMSVGRDGKAKGAKGCWLVLAEYYQDESGKWHIKQVKSRKVDGKHIKPDTWYTMKEGKFVIADEA